MKFENYESRNTDPEIINAPKPPQREKAGEKELPILEYSGKIKEIIAGNPTSIIVGETGSGKTTQIPIVMREILFPEDKVAITQPRRMAARSVAKYVAGSIGCRVGEDVGYQVRFEDHTTEGTITNFMTDGILLRKLQEDPLLRDYSVVMVDEAHERSLNVDFALGLLKRAQKKRVAANMEPLKIVVTSATLEKEKFASYLGEAPMVEVPGRLFPVQRHYLNDKDKDCDPYSFDFTKEAANCVGDIVAQEKSGDVLIFMPGEDEIKKVINEINELGLEDIIVLPLYGNMPPDDQDKIFEKITQRKIVVSTNIAETSVTVPGVRHVIDSGLIKQKEFDPSTGINALKIKKHSRSGCTQRAGRAGRIESGEYYALYTEKDFEGRDEYTKPEILRTDLAQVVLTMKKMGIDDVKSFEFIDRPEDASFDNAINTLKTLGALDENDNITAIGEKMAGMPLEPKVARMVIEAERHGCTETVCTIAAFLGGRPVFNRPRGKEDEADMAHRKFKISGSDFMTLLNVWNEYDKVFQQSRQLKDWKIINDWTGKNFLNGRMLNEVREVRYQLFRALRRNGIRATENQDPEVIGKSIAAGLVGNLMQYYGRHSYRRVSDGETGFYIHPSSVAMGGDPELIVPAEILKTNKTYARTIQAIKPEWLKEIAPQIIDEKSRDLFWDSLSGEVAQSVDICFKGSRSPLTSENRPFNGPQSEIVMGRAIANGDIDLPVVKENKESAKIIYNFWKKSAGNLDMSIAPPIGSDFFTSFYVNRVGGITSQKRLMEAISEGEIDLALRVADFISEEKMREIEESNPDEILIGSKSYKINYDYSSYSEEKFSANVIIASEDIFGFNEIPVLPSGRKLKIHITQNGYERFSGYDLEELRQKSRDGAVDEIWNNWVRSGLVPETETIEQFNILDELPLLPASVPYGKDPLDGSDLLAYPAVVISKYYGKDRYKCEIKYFKSTDEAKQQTKNANQIILEARAEQQKQEQKEMLLAPARELLKNLKDRMEAVNENYLSYGLGYDKNYEWRRILDRAERYLEQETKEQFENLKKLQADLEAAFDYKDRREKARGVVDDAIAGYYGRCPLCGNAMVDGVCNNYGHDLSRIDFQLDDNDNPVESAILSQIIDNNGRIIAQLKCNGGSTRRRGYGEVYLVRGGHIRENGWGGEPFDSLSFQDFEKILTLDQAKAKEEERKKEREARHQEEMRRQYEKDWKTAEDNVENGTWRVGKFNKGNHPQTDEDQWEITIGGKNEQTKYVVDRYGLQPTDTSLEYYYSVGSVLVNTPKFKIISVRLEKPLPEHKPEGIKGEREEKGNDGNESDVEDLVEQFNKRFGRS